MIQNETKSPEILKAERQVEQAKARLAEARRKESAKKRSEENKYKYMMGGIVHKYFPECYGFDEHELNRILAAAIKSEQCQRIIEIVKRESAGKEKSEILLSEGEKVFIWPKNIGEQYKDFNEIAIDKKLNEIPEKFILDNTFEGLTGILKLKQT